MLSSNTGQAIAVLLKTPSTGSGPLALGKAYTVLHAYDLTGPLTGHPLSALIKTLRRESTLSSGPLYVLVQTSDGYDSATGAQQYGNFPNGELRGQVVKG